MSIICVNCEVGFKPVRNGQPVLETMEQECKPYKLWMSDKLQCPGCGAEVCIINPLQKPIAEHYQDKFAEQVKSYESVVKWNERA